MGVLLAVLLKEVVPILIKNVAIPEIMRAIKRRQQAKNGEWPTEDEVFEDLRQNIFKGIEEGTDFLNRTD